jgi:hypothetical protein
MKATHTRGRQHRTPWIAFALSFVFPGAGLAYIGQWRFAVVNFSLAVAIPAIVLLTMPEEIIDRIHYLYLAIAAGSGAWAHASSIQHQRRAVR